MLKNKTTIALIAAAIFLPNFAAALSMPQTGNELANWAGIGAQSYVVVDAKTNEILISKNSTTPWTAASLTKLVTALVVLDSKVKTSKIVAITAQDQLLGQCRNGGACILAKSGVKFTVNGLFYAALIPSANNATLALARSTGLPMEKFVEKMNEKAVALGATNSHFNEPTGLDPGNVITAEDYAKIVKAAFANSYLRQIAGLQKFTLRSTNNSRYNQVIKNTDKLLADADVRILGAKTGYLNESNYNFASLLAYRNRDELIIVVLGEQHLYSAFEETKLLAGLAEVAKVLALGNLPNILGTSSQISAIKN